MYHFYSTTKGNECQELEASNTIQAFAQHRYYRDSYEPLIIPTLNERQKSAWADCASEVWVKPDGTVSSTVSCHCRFCSICAWRDARRKYAYTMRCMEEVEPLRMNYIFLTLTVQNCKGADLKTQLDALMEGINRMQSTKVWRGRVQGYIRSLEITYNADPNSKAFDTYHPHIHYILAVPPDYYTGNHYLSGAEWRQLWQRSARLDYTAQVKIEAIKGADIKSAVCEVSKYALKLSSVIEIGDAEPTQNIAETVRGRRLVAYGGLFKDIQRRLKNADKAERQLNREVSGYVYKLIDGVYELAKPTEQYKERPLNKSVLQAAYALTDAYKRRDVPEIESMAVSLIDSPPSAKSAQEQIGHYIKTHAAGAAYNAKTSIQKGKSKPREGAKHGKGTSRRRAG